VAGVIEAISISASVNLSGPTSSSLAALDSSWLPPVDFCFDMAARALPTLVTSIAVPGLARLA
jgi:hypothetical protein